MRKIHVRGLLPRVRAKVKLILKNKLRSFYTMQGKQIVHYLHIGKTGGSAIKHSFARHSSSKDYVLFLQSHTFHLNDVPEGEKVIFFLRDPISRFISGFYSRQRQGMPKYFSPWNEREKAAFELFETPNQLALALSSKDADIKRRAHISMQGIQHVRDSYMKWFISEDYFLARQSDILFIGFQESLASDFMTLKKKFGLPESAALPSDDVQSHRNPKNVDKFLEDEAIINLKNWYKDDFSFVKICENLIKDQKIEWGGGVCESKSHQLK